MLKNFENYVSKGNAKRERFRSFPEHFRRLPTTSNYSTPGLFSVAHQHRFIDRFLLFADRKSRKKKKKKTKTRPGQDPGSDPDLVSSGQLPDQALKAVGVQPGTKHEGSVQALLEGKEDIELAGVELTKEQVNIANRIAFLFLFFLSPQARRLYER